MYVYTWLVYVIAHLKYHNVIPLMKTTDGTICNAHHELFSHIGMPEQLVFVNGPYFDSTEFAILCLKHVIEYIDQITFSPIIKWPSMAFSSNLQKRT